MKNKPSKKPNILLFLIILAISTAIYLFIESKSPSDLKEIKGSIENFNLESKSERRFGNDRFDIYSFSLKENKISDLNPIDKDFERRYTEFSNMMDSFLEEKDSQLKNDIKNMKPKEDLKYKYVSFVGTEKLYLYDEQEK